MKICLVFKVKHNDSQWCFAISYLQWIVISIAYSTRLEVFQCPGRKNIKKIEEKRKKKKPTEFELISNQSIGLGWWPGWNSVPFCMDPGSVINSSEILSCDYM